MADDTNTRNGNAPRPDPWAEIESLNLDEFDVEQLEERLELAVAAILIDGGHCGNFGCFQFEEPDGFTCSCYHIWGDVEPPVCGVFAE